MTVPATDSRAGPFSGTGVIVPLPFDFKVFAQEDVLVTRTDDDGLESTLIVGVDYTVTLNPDQDADPGGTVTPTVAPAVGELTTLTSGLEYEQQIDLVTGGKFRAQTVEDGLDRTTMLIKQLKEQSDRTLHLPVSAEADVTLPVPEANALVGWNETADALQNVDPTTLATIVAFGTGVVDLFSGDGAQTDFALSANPGALANLHVSIGSADQRPGVDFTWQGGTTLHFVAPPPVGADNILVQYMQALPQGATDSAASSFIQVGAGAVPMDVQDALRDLVSVKQFGAVGDGSDESAHLQAALNKLYAEVLSATYSFGTPLKVPSLSHFSGKRAAIGMTGGTANVKAALRKTTNTTAAIQNFQTLVVSNIDCLMYTDPAWIDAGASYPQKASLERISFQGNATPNNSGIYIEQGGGYTFRELDFTNVTHAIYAKEAWLTTLERCHAFGKFTWKGGTSVTFTNCWTGAGPGAVTGGYDFTSLIYSTMNSCASDGATNTAYRFNSCSMVLNGCGCENATTATADSGTAIAFDVGNNMVVNGFVAVPQINQTIALMSVAANNEIQINGGTSYFPSVTGVNCPDIYVWGDGSTVIVRDRVFWNGTKHLPVVQFKNGVTTSKVIVHFGDNYKIYTSNGAGATLIELGNDSGTITPTITFGGGSTGMTYSVRTGSWQKQGKIITVSGRIVFTAKGSSTGAAVMSGLPAFAALGDVQVNFAIQTGITGGPLIGTVDLGGGSSVVLSSRTATGDATATEANFTNSTFLRFNFSYTIE